MNFSKIYQLKIKNFWWLDVIFYFAISLLMATIFCYFVFVIKIDMQNKEIKEQEIALESVGTDQQREYEAKVISYQKKIADFIKLFRNHEFASKVFGFMEKQTRPNVWIKRFGMEREAGSVKLSGVADNMEAFSRQVAVFEKNEYVRKLNVLNSSLGESARFDFNLDIVLDPRIFLPVSEISETTSPSSAEIFQ